MGNSITAARVNSACALSPEKVEKALFLSLFGGLVFYLSCKTIMLNHYPPRTVELALRGGLILLAFRKIYTLGRRGEGERLLLPGLICMAMLFSYWSTGYEFLLELALCIFCAIDIPYKQILRVYIAVAIICLAAGVSGGFIDLCTQISYPSNRDIAWRHSFGIVYPTDFAAHIVYILLALWACERKPRYVCMLVFAASALVLQQKLTATRCSEIVCILLMVCVLYSAAAEFFADKKWMRTLDFVVGKGMAVAMPLMAAAIIAATRLYTSGVPFWDKLNTLLSGRLQYGKEAILTYNFSLFGTAFDMYGNGGFLEKPSGYVYNFVDSSYVLLPVRYGIAVLFSLLVIYAVVILRAQKRGYLRLSQAFFLVAVACVIEQHVLELAYNPFILLAFADFRPEEEKPEALPYRRRHRVEGAVLLLLAAAVSAIMPWLWSYGKTAVHVLILGKAEERTVPAQVLLFLMAAAACVLLWGLFKLIMCLINHTRPEKRLLSAVAAFLFISGIACCTEYLLGRNMYRYTERLEKSAALVNAIRDADLSCSIRVADIPELYRREMDGTENQLLATYTASKDEDVVIFSDSAVDHESYLLRAGYTCYQVTENCIAYTNCTDAAAILLENGCSLIQ